MKRALASLVVWQLIWSPVLAAPNPGVIKIVNLGTGNITAFTLSGFDFTSADIDFRPGEQLTPAFGSDDSRYELYWRLEDGSVHGQTLVLARYLPRDLDNDPVVIGVHDDHVSVTWAKEDPSWKKYGRVGDPRVYARPTVPQYTECEGPLLEHPVTRAAWYANATQATGLFTASALDDNRCVLSWYIVRSTRPRKEFDEAVRREKRDSWESQIRSYRERRGR